ncbi:hypothetical protein FHS29_001618 [Saccharothrix tamanrassetensis]|uniref:YbaB/EbfC DNA-binding family protein n=1 Tax=Saccharothrix tamanrassetensis TaxID=1051531 RepID=A0A841CFT9_9PSEU|nr:YbaB/EbfC family nucleoid-associated protein [Saccharothrix tamanrassetensis]MBB5955048.1 hypothetical protein [Saccharothrix tamanrassetensis]
MDETNRAARRVADVETQVSEHIARTGPVFGRASSSDGAVTVVCAPGAPPQEVRISPAALNMGAAALGDEIVRVAERAAEDAAARMHQSLARLVDPATSRALTEIGFPAGAAEEDFGSSYLRGPR